MEHIIPTVVSEKPLALDEEIKNLEQTYYSTAGTSQGNSGRRNSRRAKNAMRFLPIEEFQNRLRARLHVELFVDRVQVRADRAERDAEVLADFLVEISLGEQC